MRGTRYFLALPLLGAVIFATACEEKGARRTATTPPPQATAPTIAQAEAPKPNPPAPPPQAAQQQDPVPAIIESAEREYQKGQDNYKAGHLEAAKANFDQAF